MTFAVPSLPSDKGLVEASHALCDFAEAQWIRDALEIEKTKSGAARRLRINRKTLLEKMASLNLHN